CARDDYDWCAYW
nr:immunoglobulin heavy chain junction region [Mus musculus]